jgi:large subunit ribosomal protein L21
MAFSVIKTGGKQYVVSEGQTLMIEKLIGAKEGDSVTFDSIFSDDGKEASFKGGKVTATVVSEGRDKKKIVVKYKAKSRYHKKRGHRQPFVKVKIEKI